MLDSKEKASVERELEKYAKQIEAFGSEFEENLRKCFDILLKQGINFSRIHKILSVPTVERNYKGELMAEIEWFITEIQKLTRALDVLNEFCPCRDVEPSFGQEIFRVTAECFLNRGDGRWFNLSQIVDFLAIFERVPPRVLCNIVKLDGDNMKTFVAELVDPKDRTSLIGLYFPSPPGGSPKRPYERLRAFLADSYPEIFRLIDREPKGNPDLLLPPEPPAVPASGTASLVGRSLSGALASPPVEAAVDEQKPLPRQQKPR